MQGEQVKQVNIGEIKGEYTKWESQYFPDLVCRGSRPNPQQQVFRLLKEDIGVYRPPHRSKIEKNRKQKYLHVNNEKDDRQRITDMKYPYSSIGYLSFNFGEDDIVHGSGFLIGPDIVLTNAHNVVDFKAENQKREAKNLYFYPCINQDIGQKIKVLSFEFPDQFRGEQIKWDFAVLKLSHSISLKNGFFGLHFSPEQETQFEGYLYGYLYGYPGKIKPENSQQQVKVDKKMYGSKGKCWIHDNLRLRYSITTTPGQSGSPIWVQIDGGYYVIGIHCQAGEDQQDYNEGVLLTDRVRKRINKWIGKKTYEQLNFNPTKQHQLQKKPRKKLTHKSIEALNNYKNLKELYLYNNQIGEKGVEILCDSKRDLQKLSIGQNDLKSIPMKIQNLKMLTHLFLMDNQIKQLPKEFFKLYNLEILWLSNNQIKKLDNSINRLSNLKQLYADHNKLQKLPQELFEIKKLGVLNVSDNVLSSLPQKIGEAYQLTRLNVSNNELKKLPESIKNLQLLLELEYEGNNDLVKPSNNKWNQGSQFDSLPPLPQQIQKLIQ